MGCYVRGDKKQQRDVLSGVTKTAGDVLSGVASLWDVLSVVSIKRHVMFCPGMFCPAPFNRNICQVLSTIYVDSNTNIANAWSVAVEADHHWLAATMQSLIFMIKALFTLCISTQLLTSG